MGRITCAPHAGKGNEGRESERSANPDKDPHDRLPEHGVDHVERVADIGEMPEGLEFWKSMPNRKASNKKHRTPAAA